MDTGIQIVCQDHRYRDKNTKRIKGHIYLEDTGIQIPGVKIQGYRYHDHRYKDKDIKSIDTGVHISGL